MGNQDVNKRNGKGDVPPSGCEDRSDSSMTIPRITGTVFGFIRLNFYKYGATKYLIFFVLVITLFFYLVLKTEQELLTGYWRDSGTYTGYKFIRFDNGQIISNAYLPQNILLINENGYLSVRNKTSQKLIFKVKILDKNRISIYSPSERSSPVIYHRSSGSEVNRYLNWGIENTYGIWHDTDNNEACILIEKDVVVINGEKFTYRASKTGSGLFFIDRKTKNWLLTVEFLDADRLGINSKSIKGIFRKGQE